MNSAAERRPQLRRYPRPRGRRDRAAFGDAPLRSAFQIAVSSRPFDDAADVNHDSRVTSLDALMILQAAGGKMEAR